MSLGKLLACIHEARDSALSKQKHIGIFHTGCEFAAPLVNYLATAAITQAEHMFTLKGLLGLALRASRGASHTNLEPRPLPSVALGRLGLP